jgi:lysophospholipase L1-like esterase
VPAISSAYTDDGGHLNAKGRALAAQEFVTVLAAASGQLQKIEGFATRVHRSR